MGVIQREKGLLDDLFGDRYWEHAIWLLPLKPVKVRAHWFEQEAEMGTMYTPNDQTSQGERTVIVSRMLRILSCNGGQVVLFGELVVKNASRGLPVQYFACLILTGYLFASIKRSSVAKQTKAHTRGYHTLSNAQAIHSSTGPNQVFGQFQPSLFFPLLVPG
jgi:hypothetical protein